VHGELKAFVHRSPQHVKKVVVMGANAFISHQDILMIDKVADVSAWSEK
jgi:hypothetical protein